MEPGSPRRPGRLLSPGHLVAGRLIVSPHLDDAVLSCWHAMSAASQPVTVVTLFAGVPNAAAELAPWDRASGATSPGAQMLRRRREDEAALTACGAHLVHCEFLDDQYRGWARPRRELIARLEQLAEDAEEMWLPAGIGGHPDHVLAAEAALSATVGCRRVLYADLPYAARGRAEQNLAAKLRAALIASPYAPGWPPASCRLTRSEQDAKRSCVEEYQSQLPFLTRAHPNWWRNPDVFEWEWWWPLDGGVSPRPGGVLTRIRGDWGHWWLCRTRQRWGERRRRIRAQ